MTGQDALLASAMRKLLNDSGAYVDIWIGTPTKGEAANAYVQIDGDADVTPEEARACAAVREAWRRDTQDPSDDHR